VVCPAAASWNEPALSGAPLLLGLDVGTTRIKALLIDRERNRRGLAAGATPFVTTADGVQMSAVALRTAVAEVLDRLGHDRAHIAAVGITGMAESGTALDQNGTALGPIIAWHDARGTDTVGRLQQHFGPGLAARIGQPLRPVSSVAKLGWLCAQGVRGVHRWLGVPELCLHWLSGAWATEHSLAARTGWYDVTHLRYLPAVAELLLVPTKVFLPVLTAGEVMGSVSIPGAAWSGLPRGIPVTLAGHDHLAGAEGVGARQDDLINSVGTAETVLRHHAKLPDMDRALALRLAVTVRPGGQGWAVLAGAARSGLVLHAAASALGRSLSALDDLAEQAGVADATALLRSIQQGEIVQPPPSPAGAVWNGLLHALAQQTVEAARRLIELSGPARRLVVFGGGSHSRPWMRAKAQAASIPVVRSAEVQAAARGAALAAGVAAGWWPAPSAP
jgi:xylulokinase